MGLKEMIFRLGRKPTVERTQKPRDTVFSGAIAGYNEGGLLFKEQIEGLASSDYLAACATLVSLGYTAVDDSGVDVFISAQVDALNDYAFEDCPCDYSASVLLNPFYYNNAKLYYKMRVLGQDLSARAYKLNDTDIKQAALSGDYSTLNGFMRRAMEALDERRDLSGKQVDDTLTSAMFADSLYCASGDKILKNIVKAQIDCYNYLTFTRSLMLKKPWEFCSDALIAGGKIPTGDFEYSYNRSQRDAVQAFDFRGYEFLERAAHGNAALDLSADAESVRAARVTDGNYASVRAFLSYYLRRQLEYKIVGMTLTLIKNDKRALIEPMLRGIYD